MAAVLLAVVVVAVSLAAAVSPGPVVLPPPIDLAVRGTDPVFVGAGDIASGPSGERGGDQATALLLDAIVAANPGRVTVFAAGDLAYESGTVSEFASNYDPTWGRQRAITRPIPGNHEYHTADAADYFAYWEATAGDPAMGYYAYDLGAWRIYALNSEIAHGAGSMQEQWLRADLAAHPTRCALAYTHHPRFSSGTHGSDPGISALWQALVDGGAELMLAGHDHNYQRFEPQTAAGVLDPAHGVRQWVVGTGGVGHYEIDRPIPNTVSHDDQTYGVLLLTLHPTSYDFAFVPVAGRLFRDSGEGLACH